MPESGARRQVGAPVEARPLGREAGGERGVLPRLNLGLPLQSSRLESRQLSGGVPTGIIGSGFFFTMLRQYERPSCFS